MKDAKRKTHWIVLLFMLALLSQNSGAWTPPTASAWTDIQTNLAASMIRDGAISSAGQRLNATVAVDRLHGDVYLVPWGAGIWRSKDKGQTFQRTDGNVLTGPTSSWSESSLILSPDGSKLVFFSLINESMSGLSFDAGNTWRAIPPYPGAGGWYCNWEYGAINFDYPHVLFACRHKYDASPDLYYSCDTGKHWSGTGANLVNFVGGVFSPRILMAGQNGQGIFRSTDSAKTWSKVDSFNFQGTIRFFKGKPYWMSKEGVMTSVDSGLTWKRVGSGLPGNGFAGPFFGHNEGHMIVATDINFMESMDTGRTWSVLAPLPPEIPTLQEQVGDHIKQIFRSFGYDVRNDILYIAYDQAFNQRLVLGRWDTTGKSTLPLHLDTNVLSVFSTASGTVPVDPAVGLKNTGEDVPALTVRSDSAWLGVTVSGSGSLQRVHHSVRFGDFLPGKLYYTRVRLSASGYRDTFYTVTVFSGVSAPTSIKVSPAVRLVLPGQTVQFSTQVFDAINKSCSGTFTTDWSVSGNGTISATGLYTRGSDTGSFTVTAVLHEFPSVTGTASLRCYNIQSTGLIADFAADAIMEVPDSGRVSLWPDISGKGAYASQTIPSHMPCLAKNVCNGLPAVRFDLFDDGLLTNLNLSSMYTIFIIFTDASGVNAYRRTLQGSTNNWFLGPWGGVLRLHMGYGNPFNYNAFMQVGITPNRFFAATISSDGQKTNLYINGKNYTLDSNQVTAPGILGMGTGGTSPLEAFGGDIAELLVYNRRLSDIERKKIDTLLLNKWKYKATAVEEGNLALAVTRFDMRVSPNPFNASTLIQYAIPARRMNLKGQPLSIRLYDIQGRLVRTLVNGPEAPGHHSVLFNGRDNQGRQLVNGIYFCRMHGQSVKKMQKMVLAK